MLGNSVHGCLFKYTSIQFEYTLLVYLRITEVQLQKKIIYLRSLVSSILCLFVSFDSFMIGSAIHVELVQCGLLLLLYLLIRVLAQWSNHIPLSSPSSIRRRVL